MAGGMCGRGKCFGRGVMHGRGCVWQGACVVGEKVTAADGTHPTGTHSYFLSDQETQIHHNCRMVCEMVLTRVRR